MSKANRNRRITQRYDKSRIRKGCYNRGVYNYFYSNKAKKCDYSINWNINTEKRIVFNSLNYNTQRLRNIIFNNKQQRRYIIYKWFRHSDYKVLQSLLNNEIKK